MRWKPVKSVVILGAGQVGKAARNLLNPNRMELVAIGDNNSKIWNYDAEIPILSIADAMRADPDLVMIGVLDDERTQQLCRQIAGLGYHGPIMRLSDVYGSFDLRAATFRRLADRVEERGVQGAIAELGTYRGDFAWQLNERFPDRTLYLFDTFDGFDERDIAVERTISVSSAASEDFSNTRAGDVLTRMPYENKVVIRKGFFPETAEGLEETFAIVSIDVDLYAPTLAGLEYFYPRLAAGGVILLHDYNSHQFDGVRKAVDTYEKLHGSLPLIPLSDLHGTATIIKV